MTYHCGTSARITTSRSGDARLEALRRHFEREAIDRAVHYGRTIRVAPYTLTMPGAERCADLEPIETYVGARGWLRTRSTFGDIGQPLPIARRSGFGAACKYAAQGSAEGIIAIGRPAITLDNDAYRDVLEFLNERAVFLTFLSQDS
ncbi:hypothetical protein [Streptomyces sp. NPDC048643]|uniref:hypothetical protein n=1 Tax=Streptomyces sp. NPDC048643 TaxID=3155637 RepID=UPI003429993F